MRAASGGSGVAGPRLCVLVRFQLTCAGKAAARVLVVGVKAQRLGELCDGPVEFAQPNQKRSHVRASSGRVGIESQRLLEVCHGLWHVALEGEGSTQVGVRLGIIGLDGNGSPPVGDRFRQLALRRPSGP